MSTAMWTLTIGAGFGLGVVMLVSGLRPARPDLSVTVRTLLPDPALLPADPETSTTRSSSWSGVAVPFLVRRWGLNRLATDLALLGLTPARVATRKAQFALVGLAFPPLLLTLLALAGLQLPVAVPAAAGLVVGGVLFVLPDWDVRRDARTARIAMRRATAVFLDLVALERLADAGSSEAVERAAAVCDNPQFALIRDAMTRAQLAGRPAWSGLSDLAIRTGVPELGDAADIMASAGQDGAAVYPTLRARAGSLRGQLLTHATTSANTASEHLVVPGALLGLCFMALLAYPALVRILFG